MQINSLKLLSWDLFRINNPNSNYSFQDLAKEIFAIDFGIKIADLTEYANQAGVEIDPVEVNGHYFKDSTDTQVCCFLF